MKSKTAVLIIFFACTVFAANSQTSKAKAEAIVNLLGVQKKEAMANLVQVTQKESSVFRTLYNDYQQPIRKLRSSDWLYTKELQQPIII